MLKTSLALALLALSPLAGADIYKCRLPNGSTEISNTPCPTGSGTITSRPDERVSEASRRQAEQEVEKMRLFVEKREAAQRAEEAAEREERAASQRQSNSVSRTPRQYGSQDECLRDLEQMALESAQRAQMEADCRAIARPQTIYVPVPVPAYPTHRPHHVEPPLQPKPAPKPAAPSAPQISAPQLKKN
ncbi:MAG: hypothetical protein H6R14_1758 [Proteobacteria bacterium]|nr:hypothetical protein [Pseudomonadota bacterium]